MTAVFFLFASVLLRIVWPKVKPEIHWLCPVLALALPFSAGGFHTGTTVLLSVFLMIALLEQIRHNSTVHFILNLPGIAVLLLFAAYCITPFRAADRGMAGFAFARYLPLVLYVLFLMQSRDDIQQQTLDLIPFCGCLMTILSTLALLIPAFSGHVTVNGRLAGFFQYPNSFAAFLLAGLIIQSLCSSRKKVFLIQTLLICGIVISGSKTVFVLMILFLPGIAMTRRQQAFPLGLALLLGIGTGFLANFLGLLPNADRFSDIHATSGTFLVRLLYFRDVIPAILSHPFGIGYMGYPAIEGILQTGRYSVTYIHNGFLQLLLEAGWIPGLLMAFALLHAVFSPGTPTVRRFVLLAVLSHCMMDFDLQFSIFWILLLSCTNVRSGRKFTAGCVRLPSVLAPLLVCAGLWLGCSDWLYHIGRPDACLALTPFHTQALTYQLSVSDDPQTVESVADTILSLQPTHSLAYSAKANVAFSRGDIHSMISYKESAIRFAPYTTAEYCDLFQKLYTAMQLYLRSGDLESAAYCRQELLKIPERMEAVSRRTHPLAHRTGDDPSLVLPDEYRRILQQLDP